MVQQVLLTNDMVAIVDDEDYPSVAAHKWHASKSNSEGIIKWYAARSLPWQVRESDGRRIRPKLYLHRLITSCYDPKKIVDHFNGHGLDCTRGNLMVTGYYWNNHNRDSNIDSWSGYRGVFKHHSGRWEVRLQCQHETHRLGMFADPVEGALAYDAKAIELYGPFARTNLREGRLAGKVDQTSRVPAQVQTTVSQLADVPF